MKVLSRPAVALILVSLIAPTFGAVAKKREAAPSTQPAHNEFPAEWFFGESEQRQKQDELLGKPMPKLAPLSGWINGAVTPKDMKDKILVVDFWATWCGPCLASIPHNNEVASKYKDKGVIVIGVCGSSNGQGKMADVAKERGIEYHVAKDSTQAAAKAWRVMWWPTYGVVDRSGNLRALGLKPTYVDKVIDKLLEEEKGGATTAPTAAAPDANTGPAAAKEDSAVKQEWLEGTAEERARFKGMEGKAPPALAVSNWVNGKEQKLADLKGKVVMLDFWATWCGPCIASIPHTNELQAKYKDKGLVVIGICHSQGADKMADTVKEKSIEYTVAADKGGKTVATYKVNGFPDYYFIDRAGNLRICDCSNGSVEKAIEALLAEPENASASAK